MAAAQSEAEFQIMLPDSPPEGYKLAGAWVPRDASDVRVHFAGPQGDVVLLEKQSNDGPRDPNGLEFTTSVIGYPALGVKGEVPPDPSRAVSQIQWWTGSMHFDLYGPVSYEEIVGTAASMPNTSS